MELINKVHKEFATKKNTRSETVTISKKRMTFTGGAAEACGLIIGKRIHFLLDGNCWAFIVNDKPEGYKIFAPNKKRDSPSVAIHAETVMNKFLSTTGRKLGDKFYIHKTETTYDMQTVYEIMHKKPVASLGKF